MRPLFAAILLVASCASPACSPSTSPDPPPAAEGECSLTADGLQQRPICAASGCEGELVRSDGKIECFSATEPGRLVFWVDVGADGRRTRFEPKSTGLGDGVMESHCDGDGKPLFEIARAGDQAECRCFAAGQCPEGCISALAPACCPRNALAERIESCSGSISPEATDLGDPCGMIDGQACEIGAPGCQLGRCQPLRSAPEGPTAAACCPAVRRPERPAQG